MIAAEMKSNVSIVRIHDESFSSEPAGCMKQIGQIVSASYKRRAKTLPAMPASASAPRNARDYI